jgi:hypothetical protein
VIPEQYPGMNWFNRDKEPQRFYLFPGQGGRALRQKRKTMFLWSLTVGLAVSAMLALVIYFSNGSPR